MTTLEEFKNKCSVKAYGFMADEGETQYTFFAIRNNDIKAIFDKIKENGLLEIVMEGAGLKLGIAKNFAYYINYSDEEIYNDME